MAKQFTDVRTTLYRIVAMLGSLASLTAYAQDLGTPLGTTQGVVHSDPQWSLGLQVGSVESTGISAQWMGFAGGAANFGLGFWAGDPTISGDYLWFLDQGLKTKTISPGYSTERGSLLPYAGLGLQISDGIYFRAPIGVQYTPLKDPLNIYGGLSLIVGRDMHNDRGIRTAIGVFIGIRLLI